MTAGELMSSSVGGGTRRRDDGTFVIPNVPPGRYILSANAGIGEGATAGSPREAAYKPLVVDGEDIVADIQTNTGATLSGRIVFEGTTPVQNTSASGPMAGVRARVSARPADMASSMAVSTGTGANVGGDLAFQLTGLRGAVAPYASGPGATLKSVMCGGEDIMLKGLILTGAEKIDGIVITLTTDVAMIDGIVTTAAGDPADASIVVFPEDASKWVPGSPFVRTTRTCSSPATMAAGRGATPPGVQPTSAYANRQGGFVMNGLLPGRYHVAALPYKPDSNSPAGVSRHRSRVARETPRERKDHRGRRRPGVVGGAAAAQVADRRRLTAFAKAPASLAEARRAQAEARAHACHAPPGCWSWSPTAFAFPAWGRMRSTWEAQPCATLYPRSAASSLGPSASGFPSLRQSDAYPSCRKCPCQSPSATATASPAEDDG